MKLVLLQVCWLLTSHAAARRRPHSSLRELCLSRLQLHVMELGDWPPQTFCLTLWVGLRSSANWFWMSQLWEWEILHFFIKDHWILLIYQRIEMHLVYRRSSGDKQEKKEGWERERGQREKRRKRKRVEMWT